MDRRYTFDEAIEKLDDIGLCRSIASAAEYRYGDQRLGHWRRWIPLPHRVAYYTWSITAFIEGDGADQFLSVECYHPAYAICFDTIGIPRLASGVRQVLANVPAKCLGDDDRLVEHFGSWEAVRALTQEFEEELYASSDEITSRLARYIRENRSKFAGLHQYMERATAYVEQLYPEHAEEHRRTISLSAEELDRIAQQVYERFLERETRGFFGYWWYRLRKLLRRE